MKKKILYLAISICFIACNSNDSEKEKEAELKPTVSSTEKLDKAYYASFTDSLIDFDEQDFQISKKKFSDILNKNISLKDSSIYGASVSYRVAMPNDLVTIAAFIDGNAYYVKSNAKQKPQLLISKNEQNIKTEVDGFLNTFANNKTACYASDTTYEVEGDKLILTLFTKTGKYVAIETVDKLKNAAWRNVLDKSNSVADVLSKNYEQAIITTDTKK
jgi:hypothetical protein